jgi:hypothetical protein
MVFHDRALILADGPVTAVATFRASAAERASAYSPQQAAGVVERIRRDAQGGDRQALRDMFQLVSDLAIVGLHRIPTTFFVERVHEAVSRGRLLLLPGWPQMRGYGSTPVCRGAAAEHHLARRIMKDQEHLAFEGHKYLLVPAESWTDLRSLDRHEVVPRNQAEDVLKRMAAHSAFSDRKATLEEASSSLADLQTPHARERLFLLRRSRRRVASSGASGPPAASPSSLHRRDAHVDPGMGRLVVRVRSPLGVAIAGVSVDVPGLGVMSTGGDGQATFGTVPAKAYDIRAKKPDHGPVPSGGGTFAIGDATASQTVATGATSTVELQMAAVTSVKIGHRPVVAATPLRIYKLSAADAHVDHLLTCTALCPRAAGSGPGTQVPVRVEWTFTPDAANAPKSQGGKDNTDVHFSAAPGHAMSGPGTSTASTITDDSGNAQILFRASVTSGDRFIVHGKVLRDPGNAAAGDLGHDDSPKVEVWKRLDYRNLYRMHTGGNLGFDLASHSTVPNIQPAFTPTFTEYSMGSPTAIPYREYITSLVAPTAAQLPLSGTVQIRSDGSDSRAVVVEGLVVASDGSTAAGTETLTLSGTSIVSGTNRFQKVVGVAVPPSPGRTVFVETSVGLPICVVRAHQAAAAPNFLFDTLVAVQSKAQSWSDANDRQLGADMAALASLVGAPGYCMVGAAYYHPKMDGRPTTGRTSYYAGYPAARLTYYGTAFHPDAQWGSVDGVNQDKMSCLFLNVSGGSYATMVARHEIGHASDHVSYGPGDHCPQRSCLMYAFSANNQFCTKPKEHSVRRTMGWLP